MYMCLVKFENLIFVFYFKGAPVVISYPHFLYGDPSLVDSVGGMKPDISKHETYLDLEPTLGIQF